MDEIWDTLLELYDGGDGGGVIFETLYTSLPESKSYLVHIFCNVGFYQTDHRNYRLKVSLIPIDDGVSTEADGSSAANDQDTTFGVRPEAGGDANNEDEDAPVGVGTKTGGNSLAADDTSFALQLEGGADEDGTVPAANDPPDSNENSDDEVATLVPEDDGATAKDGGSTVGVEAGEVANEEDATANDPPPSNENSDDDEVATLVPEDDGATAKDGGSTVGVGSKAGGDSPAADDNAAVPPADDKESGKSTATAVPPADDKESGKSTATAVPPADDKESGKSTATAVPPADDKESGKSTATAVPPADDKESGKSTATAVPPADDKESDKPTKKELDGGLEDHNSGTHSSKSEKGADASKATSLAGDSESKKSTGESETPAASQSGADTNKDDVAAKVDTNVHVSDDDDDDDDGNSGSERNAKQAQQAPQLCQGIPWSFGRALRSSHEETINAATSLIAEAKTTLDDPTNKVAASDLAKVSLEARAIRAIAIFLIGNYKLAAEEGMRVLAEPAILDGLATKVCMCTCWSYLGIGVPPSSTKVWTALNDGNSVSDLKALLKVDKLREAVSKVVSKLNQGEVPGPTTNVLKEALEAANKFLDELPGSTRMQVNKVHLMSRLGLWSEVQEYLEKEVAVTTFNQVSIFTGDLESKSPFSAAGQRLVEGDHHSVLQHLPHVHLAMSYCRCLVFSDQLEEAKTLLFEATSSILPLDENGQEHWKPWRSQEIHNVAMVVGRLSEVLGHAPGPAPGPAESSFYELQKCAEIKWGAIFPNDPPNAQGELLVVLRARECTLHYEGVMAAPGWNFQAINKANQLAKAVLHAKGYSPHGEFDTDKPFPFKEATPAIVDLLAARAKALARFGQHWHAWKDFGFLLQLAHEQLYGLGPQKDALKEQVEKHLDACSDQKMLGMAENESLPPYGPSGEQAVKKKINLRKTNYHGDKNPGQVWCHFFSIRLDKILEPYQPHEERY